jgi:hypothetical protein
MRLSIVLAAAIIISACDDEPAQRLEPRAPVVAPAEPTVPPAPADAWSWQAAADCIGGVELPVPPGATLRSITTGDDCMAGIGTSETNLLNVHRSTTTLAETREGIARSWQVGAVLRDQSDATRWLYAVTIAGPSPLTYAHRDDLGITCIGMRTEIDIVRRVCFDARPLSP